MAKTNKHKAQGQKKKVVKDSWWTPEKIKAMFSVIAVLVVVGIGIGIYRYVENTPDSIVGSWSFAFTSQMTGEETVNTYTFNEDKTCQMVQTAGGEELLKTTGTYSLDEKMNALTIMLTNEEGSDTSGIYTYKCKHGKLKLTSILQSGTYEYTKVSK